jgi:Fe-S cluster assembly protein SufD
MRTSEKISMATIETEVSERLESRFVSAFEMNDGHTLNGSNAKIQGLRRDAIKRFDTLGIPGRTSEAWKYSHAELAQALRHPYRVFPTSAPAKIEDLDSLLIPGLDAHLVVTVDGRFSDELSRLGALPQGVIVTGFAEAASQYADLVDRYLNTAANAESEPFTALNTAFIHDGVFVYVPKNAVVEKPIHVLNLLAASDDVFVQPRNLFIFEENAHAKFVETSHATSGARVFTNTIEEIIVASRANVDYYKVQDEGEHASQVNGTYVHQGRDSVFSVHTTTLSGGLVRNNLTVTLDEEHIESHLIGLVLPRGKQHVDVHTLIDHAKPNCVSNELYKYVLDDETEGVFNGKVFVRRDAQQTNAYQQNKSVLLSGNARMNAKPELEIYADDVKCSHGATTGELDAEAVFYLRSRGLSEQQARALLLLAFARDVVESIKIDALRDWVDAKVQQRFHA